MNNQWFGFSFENKRMANKVAKAFEEQALTIKRAQFDKHSEGANSWYVCYMVYALNPGMDGKAFYDKCEAIRQKTVRENSKIPVEFM